MSELNQILNESKNIANFSEKYVAYLTEILKKIDWFSFSLFYEHLISLSQNNKTLFIAGNGGSAATASHMANDLGAGILKASKGKKRFKVISLADNIASFTALANDIGYEKTFEATLQTIYDPGDTLLVISASGNSPNLINAAKFVRKNGGTVCSFLGFNGGYLKDLSDISIVAYTPKGEYGPVEDCHMIMDHILYTWISNLISKDL